MRKHEETPSEREIVLTEFADAPGLTEAEAEVPETTVETPAPVGIGIDADALFLNGQSFDLTQFQDYKWGQREKDRRFWAALVNWNGENTYLPVLTYGDVKELEAICHPYFKSNNAINSAKLGVVTP